MAGLEAKLDKLTSFMEEQKKPTATSNHSVELLHNKVDKLVRLLSDVAENQKKTTKLLSHVQKSREKEEQKGQNELEKVTD